MFKLLCKQGLTTSELHNLREAEAVRLAVSRIKYSEMLNNRSAIMNDRSVAAAAAAAAVAAAAVAVSELAS